MKYQHKMHLENLKKVLTKKHINKIIEIKKYDIFDKIKESKQLAICGMRQGMFWCTIEYDSNNFDRKCHPGRILKNARQVELIVLFFRHNRLENSVYVFPSLNELPYLYIKYDLEGGIISKNYKIMSYTDRVTLRYLSTI
jgi:hypothetical protein